MDIDRFAYVGQYADNAEFAKAMISDYGLAESPLSDFVDWEAAVSSMLQNGRLAAAPTPRGGFHYFFI